MTRMVIATTAACLLTLSGCGGRKIVPTKPVEFNIPADLAKAFEVKEIVAPKIEPSEAQRKDLKKASMKNQKKKKSKEGKDAIAGPGEMDFVIPNRRPKYDPLWIGEKVWMDVTWLNTRAGEFTLEVLPHKMMNGRKVYDLKGTARTSDLFSLIYKAEDWVESFVDYEGWFPYKFVLHGDESKHIRNHLELFDHGAKKQYVHIHDLRVEKNEVSEDKGLKGLTPLSQDSLSALYYVRTLLLAEGAVLKFPMTTNGSQWDLTVTVLAREEVETKMGYIKAFKTKIETRFNGVMQQQGDAFMWFSDDERKYLVRFEAKVRIGWVAGIAKRIEPGVPEVAGVAPASVPAEKVSGPTGSVETVNRKSGLWFEKLIDMSDKK